MELHRRFIVYLVVGFILFPAIYAAAVLGMAASFPHHLPPPPISNRLMFDEKLRLLRERADLDPEIIGLGSSVAAQHLNTRLIAPSGADPDRTFNGAAQGLGIHQSRFLANFYADRFRQLRLVVLLIAPLDFRECDPATAAFMKPAAAHRYAFERASLLSVYFRHFDAVQFITDSWRIADRRRPGVDNDRRVYMDRHGFLPMEASPQRAAARGLRYSTDGLDQRCFAELALLGRDMQRRDVRLFVVINPIHPEFFTRVAGASEYVGQFRMRAAAATAEAQIEPPFDASTGHGMSAGDFFDAYHLQPWAAGTLSTAIARELAKRAR